MQDLTGGAGNGLFMLIQSLTNEIQKRDGVIQSLANEAISMRVRFRALLELLEEKGVLRPDEFDARGQLVWDRDYDELAAELFALDRD